MLNKVVHIAVVTKFALRSQRISEGYKGNSWC